MTPCPYCPEQSDDLAGHYLTCAGVVAAFGPIRVVKVERRSDGLCPMCGKRPKADKSSYCVPCKSARSITYYHSLTPDQKAERARVRQERLARKRREAAVQAKAG